MEGRVLLISGSDSCGGAGMQADIAVCTSMGCRVACVVTAVTAQNRKEVMGIQEVGLKMIETQFRANMTDNVKFGAVKVGMIGSKEVAKLIGELLVEYKDVLDNIVVDPVLTATCGGELGKKGTAEGIIKYLVPIAKVLTPNLDEAKILANVKEINNQENCDKIWEKLQKKQSKGLLIKGGHAENWQGQEICDTLYLKNKKKKEFKTKRIIVDEKYTHGTGCTLSSGIAAQLANGHTIETATKNAIKFVQQRIINTKN